MSYQKQKEFLNNSIQEQYSGSLADDQSSFQKRKRIQKQLQKNNEGKQELYMSLNRNKKQAAKEIKRIRQQNRRANHKQYVVSLQQEIKKKEVQIQNLSTRIRELQMQLQTKVCHKCGNQVTQVQSLSPISIQAQLPIQVVSDHEDHEDSFRRIADESSLRICFGNKNLLFFLVTMCCLTMNSIADNPEMFFQPIMPYKLKSQMCYLSDNQKLNTFHYYSKYGMVLQNSKENIFQEWDATSKLPNLHQSPMKVSDFFNFKFALSKFLPKSLDFMLNIKDPGQMLLSFGTNHALRRLMAGGNYYM